jgi:hypothetical protein
MTRSQWIMNWNGRRRSRSQWPRGPRRGSVAARLLGFWVRIPPGAWMSVSCECCVLSGTGLCDGPIPRPEKSYRVSVCVCVCHSTIKCNKKPLHLQWVGRRGPIKKEIFWRNWSLSNLKYYPNIYLQGRGQPAKTSYNKYAGIRNGHFSKMK